MSVQKRARIIGLFGLAIQAFGLTWQGVHIIFAHWDEPLGARHLVYEPGFLLVVVGFLVSLVCVPVAIEVASAGEEDVEIPVFEPVDAASRVTEAAFASSAAQVGATRPAGRRRPARDPDQSQQSPD